MELACAKIGDLKSVPDAERAYAYAWRYVQTGEARDLRLTAVYARMVDASHLLGIDRRVERLSQAMGYTSKQVADRRTTLAEIFHRTPTIRREQVGNPASAHATSEFELAA